MDALSKVSTINKIREGLQIGLSRAGLDKPLWPTPYNERTLESRLAWIHDCTWSINEANQSIEQIPTKDYIDLFVTEWHNSKISGIPLVIEKSRRLMVSWIARSLELHDFGLKRGNALIANQTHVDAQKDLWRYWFLYDQLQTRYPHWELKPSIYYGALDKQELDSFVLPNQSVFKSINQSGESFRSTGTSYVCLEEGSVYKSLSESYAQAKTVLQGDPTQVGGHLLVISNASANPDWETLKAPPRDSTPDKPIQGCEVYFAASGVRVLRIHYSADPDKTPEWAARVRIGMDIRKWQREYECLPVFEGSSVFPDFDERVHAPENRKLQNFPFYEGSTYYCGIDCGQTLNPAASLIQVTSNGRIFVMGELSSPGAEPMSKFAPRLLDYLNTNFPDIVNDIQFVGDRTVTQRSGATGHSAFDVARKCGLHIQPVTNSIQTRLGAVTWALVDPVVHETTQEVKTRFLISGKGAPQLLNGFLGEYRYKENKDPTKDAREPEKNLASHVADALQYAVVAAKRNILGDNLKVHRTRNGWQRTNTLTKSDHALNKWRA